MTYCPKKHFNIILQIFPRMLEQQTVYGRPYSRDLEAVKGVLGAVE